MWLGADQVANRALYKNVSFPAFQQPLQMLNLMPTEEQIQHRSLPISAGLECTGKPPCRVIRAMAALDFKYNFRALLCHAGWSQARVPSSPPYFSSTCSNDVLKTRAYYSTISPGMLSAENILVQRLDR